MNVKLAKGMEISPPTKVIDLNDTHEWIWINGSLIHGYYQRQHDQKFLSIKKSCQADEQKLNRINFEV